MIFATLVQAIAPITDPLLVLLLRGLGIILELALTAGAFRAFFYFGQAAQRLKQQTEAHTELKNMVALAGEEFKRFAKEIRGVLGDHEGRLIRGEEAAKDQERRLGEVERRHTRGRRSGD